MEYTIYCRDEEIRYEVEIRDQPVLRALAHRLAHRVVEPAVNRVTPWLEPLLESRHDRHCNNDCSTMINAATDEELKACGRLPIDVWIDLWCYDLGEKGSKVISRLPINKATYNQLTDYPED